MIALLCWLLMAGSASAASLLWDYDTTKGEIPPTATVQQAQVLAGPFVNVATIPSIPSSYPEPPVPAGWTAVYYRIRNLGGDSNVVGYVVPPPPPTLESRIVKLESQVAGLCRAAKSMGGSPTSFAGRVRKEVPCP